MNSLGRHRREFDEVPGCPLGTHCGPSHSKEFSQDIEGLKFSGHAGEAGRARYHGIVYVSCEELGCFLRAVP